MSKQLNYSTAFDRINYLFQAAHDVLRTNPENHQLARYYVSTLRNIAEKSTLRLDTSIKRKLCKKCELLLLPGITATFRIKGKSHKFCAVRCIDCHTVKKFRINEHYKLWGERPESWQAPVPIHMQGNEHRNKIQNEKSKPRQRQGSSKPKSIGKESSNAQSTQCQDSNLLSLKPIGNEVENNVLSTQCTESSKHDPNLTEKESDDKTECSEKSEKSCEESGAQLSAVGD